MLEIKNVVKKYGNKIGSDHITFNVADGEIFGFIGPNGAGKDYTYQSYLWHS